MSFYAKMLNRVQREYKKADEGEHVKYCLYEHTTFLTVNLSSRFWVFHGTDFIIHEVTRLEICLIVLQEWRSLNRLVTHLLSGYAVK